LGALAYELLSGAPPFEGAGLILVKKLLTDAPRSLAARGVPAKLDALVLRLLAKKPEERPETATDVARDLDDILAAKATSTGPPGACPWPRSRSASSPRARSARAERGSPSAPAPRRRRA